MKKLQNDFTTPEQSKRLLEFGLPAESANYVYTRYAQDEEFKRRIVEDIVGDDWQKNTDFYLPCWSVGRLIEIYNTCYTQKMYNFKVFDFGYTTPLRVVLDKVVDACSYGHLDFSKLED